MNIRMCLCAVLTALLPLSAGAAGFAEGHSKMGVPCEACHLDKKNPQIPTIEQCTACHALDALVKKTAGVKPHNPHTSPHYQDKLDCNNCHVGHSPSENFCGQCHNYEFKVP